MHFVVVPIWRLRGSSGLVTRERESVKSRKAKCDWALASHMSNYTYL